MRKILLMLCLLLGHAAAIFADTHTYVLDENTLQTSASGKASFSNGLTITNGGGKTISQYGETDFLKFSNGVQYTVSGIPSGETVESVVFYGYPHEAGNQCYIAEFNGVNEDPSTADFSEGTADAPKSYNFQEWGITSGSFTFTVKAHQTCMRIEITTTSQKLVKFEKDAYSFDLTDPTANDHMPVPENTTGSDITYSSSNTDVAACLNGAKPRIKSPGTTTITATAGSVSTSYTLTVTSPQATYDLTGNAFEVKSIGALDKKSFDLDGLTFTFGGKAESPVAVAQPDLGVGVMSLDFNGFSFFDNDLSSPMGSYIVLKTTKAGTLNVRGNFANSSSVGWSHVYKQSDKSAVNNFTQGSGYQSVHLDANTTYYLTTWRADDQYPTFYLKGISYTPEEGAQSANQEYTGGKLNNGGAAWSWPAKKGQMITFTGQFPKERKGPQLDFTNIVDMQTGVDVNKANINGTVSYLVKEDGDVTMTNNSDSYFTLTSAVLSNSTPSLTFEKGATPTVGVKETSFTNVVNNAPVASAVTYKISSTNNVTASIDSNTGTLTNLKFTNGASSGTITVTATSSAVGYYNQGSGSYTLSVLNLYFNDPAPHVTLDISGAVSYEQKVQGAPGGVIPTYSYQVTSGNPAVYLDQEEGLPDYNLTIKGIGTIVVTATCGTATASYTLTVSGLTFADVSPSISVDKESKGFSQQPEDATVAVDKWEIIHKSETIKSADIDSKSGNITKISGHGIIVVKATSEDGKSAGYVLTVADCATDDHELVWDFATKGNLPNDFTAASGNATTGAGEKSTVKDVLGRSTGWTTKYEGLSYDNNHKPTKYNRFIYTCDQPIDGDNALFIPATAGLQFSCNANTFGLNNADKNDDRHVSFKGNNNHDNVLTIPQLKQGQYVTIWWDPYSAGDDSGNGNAGSTFRVDNATDLAGTPITNKFSTTSIEAFTSNSPRGQITFRARYNGDMNFYIQDNGWNNIYKIRVSNNYSTDLRLFDGSKGVNPANNNMSILDGQTVLFKGNAGQTHSQAARYPRFTVKTEGNFSNSDVEVSTPSWTSKGGVTYQDLQLKVNGGTGNILVTQDICFGADKYVLDRSETYLAVGQRKQQTYPYTWDFTAYNMDAASDKTVGHLSSTTANAYGSWSNNALDDYTSVASPSGLKGYNIDKPLFANGSQLTYGTTTVRETEGLGVTLAGTGADYNGKVGIDGNTLALTAAGTQLTIPSVDAGMYVFVKANNEPTGVTNAAKETPADVSLPTTGEYVYKVGTTGDVVLTFPASTNIEKIGVTNIFKTISGKATSESRDRAIDYSQTGVFTNMGVKAYIATQYSDKNNEPDMGTLTLKDVTATPAETGLLLYKVIADGKTNETQTNFPLFVPAVNIAPTTDKGMLKPHVTEGTVDGSNATTLRYVFTNKYYHHGSSEQQTGDDYLFYRVEQSGTLAANKAYLELERSKAAKQFIVMSFDETPTGIHTPQGAVEPSDGAYFTLQGVRVNGCPTRPGLYIHNGKKVIVKK